MATDTFQAIPNLGGHFGPEKKIFSPPTPQILQFAAETLPAPRPFSLETPPTPGSFQYKPPPPHPLGTSPSPTPGRKKVKNIRNVHQETNCGPP